MSFKTQLDRYSSYLIFAFWIVVVATIGVKINEWGKISQRNNTYLRVLACVLAMPAEEKERPKYVEACWKEAGIDPATVRPPR